MTEITNAEMSGPDGSPSRLDLLEAFADGGETFARAVAPPELTTLDRPADGPAPAARGTDSHNPRNFGDKAVTNRPWKLVRLSRTYAIHDKAITELRLKEPTLDDYAELGEPVEVHTSPDGIRIATENLPALRGYIERCVDGIDPANLGMLGLPDARALRDALHSFFFPPPRRASGRLARLRRRVATRRPRPDDAVASVRVGAARPRAAARPGRAAGACE